METRQRGYGIVTIEGGDDDGKFEVARVWQDGFAHIGWDRIAGPFGDAEMAAHHLVGMLMRGES